jgi:type IV secretion system protein VirB6
MICRPLTYGDGFVRGVLDFVDCQAQNIGTEGYRALAAPGSPVSIALTGMLTLFIAIYGYRMLMGHVPSARDGVLAMVKIGIVLALATSWPAYRVLAYDVALHGPAQMARDVGQPARLPGTDGGLTGRLQGVDAGLLELARAGVGNKPNGQTITRERVVNGQRQLVTEDARGPVDEFEPLALGYARITYLVATLSALAAVRLTAGLLLALGPLFIAFLLFEGTRGLFEGWVRALAGAALGAVAVTILLGAQLALIEPWLMYLIAMRQADLSITGAPVELFAVMLVFGIALIGALYAAARVATGFRLPPAWRALPDRIADTLRANQPAQPRMALSQPHIPAEERSRAAAVVEAVSATQRRETRSESSPGGGGAPSRGAGGQALQRDLPPAGPVPIGQSYGRRTRTRVSSSAGRRDHRS